MRKTILGLIASLSLLTGCMTAGTGGYTVPVRPPIGFILTHYKAPLQTNMYETRLGSKVGVARTQYIRDPVFTQLPLIAWGEASVEAAARDAGIKKVEHADYEVLSLLGIYIEFTVRVYGD
jgi:hypothetical protein